MSEDIQVLTEEDFKDTDPRKEGALPKRHGIKGFFMKDDRFSKTATFATVGTVLVLFSFVLSWFAGSTFTLGEFGTVTFPEFNSTAAMALLGILNGTYIGNNLIKSRAG